MSDDTPATPDATTPPGDATTPPGDATTTPPPGDGTTPAPATTSDDTPPKPEVVFFFPHELADAELTFDVDSKAAAPTAEVFKHDAAEAPWVTQPVAVAKSKGTLPIDFISEFVLADTENFGMTSSPFLVKGPPLPTAPATSAAPDTTVSAKGKLGISFGKDKLTINFALNGGGGATAAGGGGGGGGVGGAGGQGGAVSFAYKQHAFAPVFPVGALLESDESLILALRCVLRYFYHWCDALDLGLDYVLNQVPKSKDAQDVLTQFVGVNWWMTVFSMFAMKDMICDMGVEEGDFIASLLQKIGVESKFDISAAANVDVLVGVDANALISGKAYIPLAVILAPLIEFMMAGSKAPKPAGGTLADKIVPFVEGVVEERMNVAVGAMPAAVMVEAKGILAKCTFAVPKGSPLRKKIESVGASVSDAAEHYKQKKMDQIQKRPETALLRVVIDLLDHEVANIVKLVRAGVKAKKGDASAAQDGAAALGDAVTTAGPFVQQIMAAVQGKPSPTSAATGPSAAARGVADAIARGKVQGTPLGAAGACEVAPSGDKQQITLHADDDELAALRRGGFSPTPPPVAELETTTFEVILPQSAAAVGWSTVTHNSHLARDYAGIVVGFDNVDVRKSIQDFACAQQQHWVPSELGDYLGNFPEEHEGLHWAWIAVGLSAYLAARPKPVPMPTLALDPHDGSKLRVTFDQLEAGAIGDDLATAVPLLSGASKKKTQIWKVTLLDGAEPDDVEAIRAALDANQPNDDPYASFLDDVVKR